MHADNCVIYEFCLRDERGQHSIFVIEGWHWAQLVWDENQQLSSSSDHIIFLSSPLEMSFIASKKWEHNLCKETLFLFPVFDCSYVCKVCFCMCMDTRICGGLCARVFGGLRLILRLTLSRPPYALRKANFPDLCSTGHCYCHGHLSGHNERPDQALDLTVVERPQIEPLLTVRSTDINVRDLVWRHQFLWWFANNIYLWVWLCATLSSEWLQSHHPTDGLM